MHTIFSNWLIAVLAAALPQFVAADNAQRPDGPRPEARRQQPKADETRQRRPSPEVMFKRLDADHDGVIKADEIPAGMPGRLKEALEHAINSHDGKLTLSQFTEVTKQHRPGPRPEGRPGEPQGQRRGERALGEPREGRALAERRAGRDEGRGPWGQWSGEGRGPREMAPGPQGRFRHPEAGPFGGWHSEGRFAWNRDGGPCPYDGRWRMESPGHRHYMAQWGWQQHAGPHYGHRPRGPQASWARLASLDPTAVFARLDRDKDGKLSLEEFSTGMRRFQHMLAGGMQQRHARSFAHSRHHGQHSWAMHQQWSPPSRHEGWHHGHAQFAHWTGKKSEATSAIEKSKAKREMKKPEAKKPAGEKKTSKPNTSGVEAKAIEAQLMGLRREIDERAAGLAKLKKAEDSLRENLTKLERQRGEVVAKLCNVSQQRKAKELATAEKGPRTEKKREKKPADEKKPAQDL